MFKYMPTSFVDTCIQLYGVSITDYNTLYGPTPSTNINRDTMINLFLEPFLRWLTVGSRGYRLGALTTNANPDEPTVT
jgi:hypothetical protein